jgi:hypothetical protein
MHLEEWLIVFVIPRDVVKLVIVHTWPFESQLVKVEK